MEIYNLPCSILPFLEIQYEMMSYFCLLIEPFRNCLILTAVPICNGMGLGNHVFDWLLCSWNEAKAKYVIELCIFIKGYKTYRRLHSDYIRLYSTDVSKYVLTRFVSNLLLYLPNFPIRLAKHTLLLLLIANNAHHLIIGCEKVIYKMWILADGTFLWIGMNMGLSPVGNNLHFYLNHIGNTPNFG